MWIAGLHNLKNTCALLRALQIRTFLQLVGLRITVFLF